MPRANAARMCEIAGSPVAGLRVVSSTAISARGGVQKLFDGCGARAEGWILREAAAIGGRAVPQRMDAGDGERELAPLPANEAGERAPHVAIADQCELQDRF